MTSSATRDNTVAASPVTTTTMTMTTKRPQPATAAQRQRAYRMRSKRAVTQAIGQEDSASRVTLLALLGSDLALLEDESRKSMHTALRNSARRVLRTLVTRYGIDPGDHS
jgi:hypothetical protein